MNILPRCVGVCRDNTQCSRRVVDGSNPPTCHLHRAKPNLSPIIPPPDEVDAMKILRRLAHDRDARVRLRAVDLLIRQKTEKDATCPRCELLRRDANYMDQLTKEQRAEIYLIVQRLKAIKAMALTQPVQGDM